MSSILLSFCNLPVSRSTGILRLELDSEATSEVELGWQGKVESCTGLCADDDRIYVLFVSEDRHYLGALSRNDLQPLFHQPLPEVESAHSILAKDSYLYVVSTGTDEVLRYDLTAGSVNNPRVVWRASASQTDNHHVNSITEWRGNLVVSAFGPKFGTLWASALEGYIHDIDRDVRIKGGLYHPHSLCARRDCLYFFESPRGLFSSLEGPVFSAGGYARGACWLSDDIFCLGNSIGRKVSKSTGLISNPADPGIQAGSCGIILGEITSGRCLKRIDFGWFGPEIYDLLVEV